MLTPNTSLGCENQIFAVYDMRNSLLSHKRMRQSFSERRDAHNDTKNMWGMYRHFGDKFIKKQ